MGSISLSFGCYTKFIRPILWIVGIAITFCISSCSTIRPGIYFKNVTRDTVITNTTTLPAPLKIKAGDIVSISVSSLNNAEDAIFVSKDVTKFGDYAYQVDEEGQIYFQRLGALKAAGKTRKQLKEELQTRLQPFLKEPFVQVAFLNQHITLIGELAKPQILELKAENISIVDALAESGVINPATETSQVMIIREKDNEKHFKSVNLKDYSVFSSPYYYLQPNDVVLVGQNDKKIKDDILRDKYTQGAGIVLQALTVLLLIYQVIIRR
jgi:polysaccharide biosynthesis/export protein